jgi:aminopeptidase N
MSEKDITKVYRDNYQAYNFLVDHVYLEFDLDPADTRIISRVDYRHNLDESAQGYDLKLNGDGIVPLSIKLDGDILENHRYDFDGKTLTILNTPARFTLQIETSVIPQDNNSLMGMCVSQDKVICTQCEPEAFRKMTFFPDRPDVLATYTVKLIGDKTLRPVMLSNGHPIEKGELGDNKHYVLWSDPVVKPCYIFALCAGQIESVKDSYTFKSGKTIELGVYATKDNIGVCAHSMEIIKKAIKWDEDVFGREYDLDIYNCAAFSGVAGGMENKGLNMFDLNWFGSDPRVSFDPDYDYRTKTIAHEYFHNWSGDIVTVKSWFETGLKEGLTRFRDQRFLGDMTNHEAVRIKMARHIRGNQWAEDDSALAHPVIRDSYVDPRNTFSCTVYDKGQEIIYMIFTLLGKEKFYEGVIKYFDDNANTAVTIDEFLSAFEDVSGRSMAQMREWYFQTGTPRVKVKTHYDQQAKTFDLTFVQNTAPSADQPQKKPMQIPVASALLDQSGNEMPLQLVDEDKAVGTQRVLDFNQTEQRFRFINVKERPVPSLFRHFSASVAVEQDCSDEDLAHLLKHDSDGVTRWDVSEQYASRVILRQVERLKAGLPMELDEQFMTAYGSPLDNITGPQVVNKRVIADIMTLPDEKSLGQGMALIPIDEIHQARVFFKKSVAALYRDRFLAVFENSEPSIEADVSPHAVANRRLKSLCLDYLLCLGEPGLDALALQQVKDGVNLSDQIYALISIADTDSVYREEALDIFKQRWANEQLVLDRWFRALCMASSVQTISRIEPILKTNDFNRALLGSVFNTYEPLFCENRYAVNEPGGSGYKLLVREMVAMDRQTPLVATYFLARCDIANWRQFDGKRQVMIKQALTDIRDADGVSDGLIEIAEKSLGLNVQ